jgi:hypothetical protein
MKIFDESTEFLARVIANFAQIVDKKSIICVESTTLEQIFK